MAERLPDPSLRSGQAPADPRGWDDATLVAALRREERQAFAELYGRFAPRLARLARLWGVPDGEREPLAAEVLGDVAMSLVRHAAPAPRSLAAYLATALRRRVGVAARARGRRARLAGAADDSRGDARPVAPPSHDPEITGDVGRLLCSEHALRAADPDASPAPLDPAVARLAGHLIAGIGDDDRRLLLWLAHDVPLRTAAGWLGIGYEAAGKRAQRLRARLRRKAEEHVAALGDAEGRAVRAILRRAGAPTPEGAAAGAPASPSQETER
jgi:DNA-directed RNA polymerase specialized sigma24 family protein